MQRESLVNPDFIYWFTKLHVFEISTSEYAGKQIEVVHITKQLAFDPDEPDMCLDNPETDEGAAVAEIYKEEGAEAFVGYMSDMYHSVIEGKIKINHSPNDEGVWRQIIIQNPTYHKIISTLLGLGLCQYDGAVFVTGDTITVAE